MLKREKHSKLSFRPVVRTYRNQPWKFQFVTQAMGIIASVLRIRDTVTVGNRGKNIRVEESNSWYGGQDFPADWSKR